MSENPETRWLDDRNVRLFVGTFLHVPIAFMRVYTFNIFLLFLLSWVPASVEHSSLSSPDTAASKARKLSSFATSSNKTGRKFADELEIDRMKWALGWILSSGMVLSLVFYRCIFSWRWILLWMWLRRWWELGRKVWWRKRRCLGGCRCIWLVR